jgi:hypothetical protein
MDTVTIALTYEEVQRLTQALSLAQDAIMEITAQCQEDPFNAQTEIDVLKGKLGDAYKLFVLRRETADLERQLLGEPG